MWASFIQLLFDLLQQLYYMVGDWGLAIIVFTVIIRLLMTPLMIKQTRSMYDLQKIQPLMKEIQEEYADDKELQSQKLAELYAEHKVNPFSSCLPMLLQLPIFMALYQMLAPITERTTGGPLALYLASTAGPEGVGRFFGIIPNIMLSASDVFAGGKGFLATIPYFILLALFAVSVYVPQLLQQQAAQNQDQPNQKMMSIMMVIMMLWFGWRAPAGVLLYWDTSSIIGIAQQWFTQRQLKNATEESTEIEAVKKPAKKPTKKTKKN
ncbi:MAG: YidC/Oxa1 family membrane protein insertase [Coriobacteriia bacterium]|nr:YidC/Oxa1 family membrane protein insertase [Coriobacteriia bacterium]